MRYCAHFIVLTINISFKEIYMKIVKTVLLLTLALVITSSTFAQAKFEISAGADFVSRYVWRGQDFGNAPSIQPYLSGSISGFEVGFWGAYTFSNNNQGADELDAWISYTANLGNDMALSFIVTDYYFPNAGKKLGNFNDHDGDPPGAHLFEGGVAFTGPSTFPITVSAYLNFYNDEGNNAYFQIDYPFSVEDYDLSFFAGATPGSEDNPGYYGAEDFSVVQVGIGASKEVKITDEFSLPVFVQYSINPKPEISYLVFGVSL